MLLIVVDQWRGDTLRATGRKTVKTSNIDKLIAESVTFRRHYTVTSPCGPARASLLTDMYAGWFFVGKPTLRAIVNPSSPSGWRSPFGA